MLSSDAIRNALGAMSCEITLVSSADPSATGGGYGDIFGDLTSNSTIEKIIAKKVATLDPALAEWSPKLEDGIDVPNGIFILYSKDFISGNKDEVLDLQSRFAKAWWVAMTPELDRQYRVQISLHSHDTTVGALAGETNQIIPHIEALFPYLHRVIADKASADALPKDLRDILSGRGKVQLVDGRIPFRRAKELDRQVAQVLINNRVAALHKELQVFAGRFIMGHPSVEEMFIQASVARGADGQSTGEIPFWNSYLRTNSFNLVKNWYRELFQEHLQKFISIVAKEFPLSPHGIALSDNLSVLLSQIQSLEVGSAVAPDEDKSHALVEALQERVMPALVSIQAVVDRLSRATKIVDLVGPAFVDGGMTAHLPSIPATVRFNRQLGALEMGPLETVNHRPGTSDSASRGDDVVAFSGAGTNKSTLASLRALVPKLRGYGTNLLAVEAPDRGFGIQLRGHFNLYMDYFKRLFHILDKRTEGSARSNRIGLGRSMGAIELAYLLLIAPDTPVDVIVSQSTALWPPANASLQGIYDQLRNGSISAILKQALVDATNFNNEGGALLEAAERLHPEAFETTGAEILFWYGNDDEDYPDDVFRAAGLPTYAEMMAQTRDRFFPLASLYPFYNRLKHLSGTRHFPPMMREGSHFVLHNTNDYTLANLNREEREVFRGIPEELLPQRDSQTHEAIASLQIKKDLLADGLPGGYDWPQVATRKRQEQLQQERLRLCGLHADGSPVSYFEHFILHSLNPLLKHGKKAPITTESLYGTAPGGETLVSRMARAHQWGQQEMQRLVRHLKAKGYLPENASEEWGRHIRIEGRSGV